MKLATALVIAAIATTTPALANTRTVYEDDLKDSIELKVWKGYGLTINFMSTGESIKQVWIGDPSRFTFTSNGNLCSKENADCGQGKANVIFIRQIKPIEFDDLTSSPDGSTQIIVLTNEKQYQFTLLPVPKGKPTYTALSIKSSSDKPEPIAITPPESKSEPMLTVRSNLLTPGVIVQRNDANALAVGLAMGIRQGTIKYNSNEWKKIQSAIALLRRGKTINEAATISKTDFTLLNTLIEQGRIN